ncbi:MAG: sigma-54-dependent transcriptional regulator [Desulfovibrio sp.]
MAETILVVEDDEGFRGLLQDALEEDGHNIIVAGSAEEGLQLVTTEDIDLILHDVKLPGMSGIEALPKLKEQAPDIDVIIMTGYTSRGSGVQAVQQGAYDYFSKPFKINEMQIVVRRALEKRRLHKEVAHLKKGRNKQSPIHDIIGNSPAISRVKSIIERVAALDANVLVIGETGTGKELISDTLHALSGRKSGPFVKLNCAAIPESLMESELFGHEKGAFTGASSMRKGKFELAESGTILLDEIGDMPLHLQPKLLRAVEQKQVERVGGKKPITFDVRIIAATNQFLEEQVKEKKFRSDLYYRLNVASILLPPLRERREDIPLLASFFLDRINSRLGTQIQSISSKALKILSAHDWPGNVRQFANAMERAAIFCQSSIITPEDLELVFSQTPGALPEPPPAQNLPLKEALQEFERKMIMDAMGNAQGSQKDAADKLGISAKNLWNKLQKHGIDPQAYRST